MHSATVGSGHNKMPGRIYVKPPFIKQLSQRAAECHPCGAERTGDVLMGEAELEPQIIITGLTKSKIGVQG